MALMSARMKDIARELGVSVVTVSKVLRNHDDISPETRARVLQRMKELNYRPNLAARALVTGRTHMVGLVVPDLLHAFFAQVAKGLSKVLRAQGYGLVISSSEEDPELEQQEIEQMLARRLDVVIVASAQWTVESFRRIEDQKTPYVLIDRRFLGLTANFVGTDDVLAGSMATEHLIENGCRLIAHIGGQNTSPPVDRLEGFRIALARNGLVVPSAYIVCKTHGDDAGDSTGYLAMKELLRLKPLPDGVFCYNDPTAMGAMKAIIEAGYRIPEDIAIVGSGNVHYANFLRVPLTSIDQNSELIGEHAANLALNLVKCKTSTHSSTLLVEPRLVFRQSSDKRNVLQISG